MGNVCGDGHTSVVGHAAKRDVAVMPQNKPQQHAMPAEENTVTFTPDHSGADDDAVSALVQSGQLMQCRVASMDSLTGSPEPSSFEEARSSRPNLSVDTSAAARRSKKEEVVTTPKTLPGSSSPAVDTDAVFAMHLVVSAADSAAQAAAAGADNTPGVVGRARSQSDPSRRDRTAAQQQQQQQKPAKPAEKKNRLWRCRTCGRHFWGRDNAEAHFFCLTNERIERLVAKENARRAKASIQAHGTL